MRIRPIQNTKSAGVVGQVERDRGRRRVAHDEAAVGEADEQDEQADADADRPLSASGTAFMIASRRPTRTRMRDAMPSRTITPIAPAGDRPLRGQRERDDRR